MVELSLTLNTDALEKALEQVPNLTARSLNFRFKRIGAEFTERMTKVFTAQPSGAFGANKTSNKLINRTGALRRSLNWRVFSAAKASDLVLRATVGDSITGHYARTQEFGATIKPKRARRLAIPLPANKTAAGRVRFPNPRSIEGLFLLNKNGRQLLVRKDPSGDGLEFLFILKDQVTIPPRLGFRRIWFSKKMNEFRLREINLGVAAALERAGLL